MIRLTGGEWNGRPLRTPTSEKTRPTQARLRQALMNSLQFKIPDTRVLDLFAGSGALGFEALSRGATDVVFLDLSKQATKVIEQNAKELKCADRIRILQGDWKHLLHTLTHDAEQKGRYDLIFCDPPYAEGMELGLLNELPFQKILSPGGIFSLEWGRKKSVVDEVPEKTAVLTKVREKTYGESILTHYELLSENAYSENESETGEEA